jgi:hypothetical protein
MTTPQFVDHEQLEEIIRFHVRTLTYQMQLEIHETIRLLTGEAKAKEIIAALMTGCEERSEKALKFAERLATKDESP